MLFRVLTGAGYGGNSGATGNREARVIQPLSERRMMLSSIPDSVVEADEDNLYNYVMSMPEGPAKEIAIDEMMTERMSPKYWYGDETPRDHTLRSSSSWVGDLDYDPNTGVLRMGKYMVIADPADVTRVLNGNYHTTGSVGRSLINLWRNQGFGDNYGKPFV
jgi:hypothetical protein